MADRAGPSAFLATVAIPAGAYATLAAPRRLMPMGFTAALTGVGGIAYWVYEWITAVRGS